VYLWTALTAASETGRCWIVNLTQAKRDCGASKRFGLSRRCDSRRLKCGNDRATGPRPSLEIGRDRPRLIYRLRKSGRVREALIAELAPTGALEEVSSPTSRAWSGASKILQRLAVWSLPDRIRNSRMPPRIYFGEHCQVERAKVDEVIDGAMTRRGKNSGEKAHEIAIVGRYGNALKGRDRLTADPASGRRDGGKSWLPLANTGPRYRR
jgi:hypothetical protein